MQQFLLTTLLCFSIIFLKASTIDSLKNVLKQQSNVDAKIETLLRICEHYDVYKSFNKDSLEHYGIELLAISEQTDNRYLQTKAQFQHAVSLNNRDTSIVFQTLRDCTNQFLILEKKLDACWAMCRMASRYRTLSMYVKSKALALEGVEMLATAQNEEEGDILIRFYSLIATANQNMDNLPEALEYVLKAKALTEEFGSIDRQIRALLSIGALYGNMALDNRDYGSPEDRANYRALAKDYIHQTYTLAQTGDNLRMQALATYNLGLFYSEEKDWKASNYYFDQAITLSEKLDALESLINSLSIKGANFMDMEPMIPDSAFLLFERAYELAYKTLSPSLKINANDDLGTFYFDLENYSKALMYYKVGLQIAIESNLPYKIKNGHNNLYKVYKKLGDKELALQSFEKFVQFKDSLVGASVMKKVELLRAENETVEKEKEIAQLKAEKTQQSLGFQMKIGISIIAILLLGLGATFLLFRNRNKILEAKQESIELEQRLLRSQMNPHFTFNALGAIQSHLLNGDARLGALYLTKFAKLMRQILSQSNNAMIPLQEEISTINNYLSLQKLRYENQFDFQIDLDPSLDVQETMIPPMLIQPILENAIEHGKIHRKKNGKVSIEISRKKNLLHVDIIDNGVGRKSNSIKKSPKNYESVALKIINRRLTKLKEKYGKNIDFEVMDPVQGGTMVVFDLPLIKIS